MTADVPGIIKRGNKYTLRTVVPLDLRKLYGTAQIWRTLGTGNEREARRRARIVRAELEAEFARRRLDVSVERGQRRHTDAELEALARELFERELELDDAERSHYRNDPSTDPDLKGTFPGAFSRPGLLAALKADTTDGLYHHVAWWVDAVIARDGLKIAQGSADWRFLAYSCQRVMIDAITIRIDRDNHRYGTRPTDPIITTPVPVEPPARDRMTALFDRFVDLNPSNVAATKLKHDREYVRLFVEFVGDLPPAAVTKVHVREWRNSLERLPTRANQMSAFRGKAFPEIIGSPEAERLPKLNRRTINKYLSALSTFFAWAIGEGYRDDRNPCDDLAFALDKTEKKRRSYTRDELVRIFSDREWFDEARDHRFWLPILALFTGARLGELAQLNTADVIDVENRACIFITDRGTDQTLKNQNSKRLVPLHAEIVRLGFLAYVRARNTTKVFPGVDRNSEGQWAASVSRDWGRFLKRLGFNDVGDATPDDEEADPLKVTFHSFRHGVADALRRRGYGNDEFDILLGHKSSQTGDYGTERAHVLGRKIAMVDDLDYGLDLSHLHGRYGATDPGYRAD